MRLIGLSGGGPYVLAAGAALPDRVLGVAVIGGVAPSVGDDAVVGEWSGSRGTLRRSSPSAGCRSGSSLTVGIRLVKPFAGRFLDLYALVQPEGDKRLLGRPEIKAMFVDDLLNGSRKQVTAPLSDLLLFSRDWGFRVEDVKVPVRWFHGDADHIVPFAHGAPRRRPAARRDHGDDGGGEPPRRARPRRGHPHRAAAARPRQAAPPMSVV